MYLKAFANYLQGVQVMAAISLQRNSLSQVGVCDTAHFEYHVSPQLSCSI